MDQSTQQDLLLKLQDLLEQIRPDDLADASNGEAEIIQEWEVPVEPVETLKAPSFEVYRQTHNWRSIAQSHPLFCDKGEATCLRWLMKQCKKESNPLLEQVLSDLINNGSIYAILGEEEGQKVIEEASDILQNCESSK